MDQARGTEPNARGTEPNVRGTEPNFRGTRTGSKVGSNLYLFQTLGPVNLRRVVEPELSGASSTLVPYFIHRDVLLRTTVHQTIADPRRSF